MSSPAVAHVVLRPWRLLRRAWGAVGFVARLLAETAVRDLPDHHPARAERLTRAAQRFCALHDLEVVLTGTWPEGPKVVIMNHLGYLDPLVLAAVQPVLPIAKSEVAGWPLIGRLGRALGVLFVARGRPYSGFRVLRRARRALAAGASVLNFAEGTTSYGDDVLPLHRGLFGIARHAQVPVVPVRLRFEDRELAWVGDDAFLPHYVDLASRSGARVFLEVLAPIPPGPFARAEDLAEATRAALRGRGRSEPTEVDGNRAVGTARGAVGPPLGARSPAAAR